MRFVFILSLLSGTLLNAQVWTQYGPLGRFSHSALYDPASKQMIVFGGQNPTTSTDLNDLWLVSTGADRHVTALSMSASNTGPSPRFGHVATYDANSNRMTVFGGGLGIPSPCTNDVWVLDGANGRSGPANWLALSPSGTLPAARVHAAAVYDPTSNSMIVFGGNNCSTKYFNDVWVLSNANGSGGTPTWTQLTPSGTLPSVRQTASAVYDSTNNVMIVFGGDANGVPFSDVWVLSNANGSGGTPQWSQLFPTGTVPMARTGHSAIYDSVHNVMTIFGGFYRTRTLADSFTLSFANGIGGTPAWTKLTATGTSPTLGYHSAVYDSIANSMYVFAGSSSASKLAGDDHVFILSNANGIGTSAWTRGGPPTRHSQSMFYDSVSNSMFVFGGQHALLNTNFSDYWQLTGAIGSSNLSWVSPTVKGTHPATRWGHTGLYDSGSNRMMVFGGAKGFPTPCLNDYWVMSGANNNGIKPTWIAISPTGTLPPVRTHHTVAYASSTNSMIVFGGYDCQSTYYNDVWVLSTANAVGSTPAWTQLSPVGTAPSPRQSSSAVYSASANTLTVFGGDAGDAAFGDIWILSNANGSGGTPAWTQITPSNNGPVARSGHTATYDELNNLMTVYGGWSGTALLNDAWVLSSANGQGGTSTWTQIVPQTTGPARRFHSAIYDPVSNQLNIFGGVFSQTPFFPDDHVYSLTHANGLP